MIQIQNSQVANGAGEGLVLLVESKNPSNNVNWKVEGNQQQIIELNEFPQADHNESTGQYRIEFKIEGNTDYGVFAIFTEWNKLYYTTDLDSFVASDECLLLDRNGHALPALQNGSMQSVYFSISINRESQIWVVGDIENISPIIPPQE